MVVAHAHIPPSSSFFFLSWKMGDRNGNGEMHHVPPMLSHRVLRRTTVLRGGINENACHEVTVVRGLRCIIEERRVMAVKVWPAEGKRYSKMDRQGRQ